MMIKRLLLTMSLLCVGTTEVSGVINFLQAAGSDVAKRSEILEQALKASDEQLAYLNKVLLRKRVSGVAVTAVVVFILVKIYQMSRSSRSLAKR